jgi:DNA mismatch endonuclease, patch repair protein
MRYRKNKPIPTGSGVIRPDLVFSGARVVVFVDGCFWHCCPAHGNTPRANSAYWETKLRRNVERDRLVTAALSTDGWTVLRVWEHESVESAADSVEAAVRRSTAPSALPGGRRRWPP